MIGLILCQFLNVFLILPGLEKVFQFTVTRFPAANTEFPMRRCKGQLKRIGFRLGDIHLPACDDCTHKFIDGISPATLQRQADWPPVACGQRCREGESEKFCTSRR